MKTMDNSNRINILIFLITTNLGKTVEPDITENILYSTHDEQKT